MTPSKIASYVITLMWLCLIGFVIASIWIDLDITHMHLKVILTMIALVAARVLLVDSKIERASNDTQTEP